MKTFDEIWAEIAEENLKDILMSNLNSMATGNLPYFRAMAKENIAKSYKYYNQLREQILHGGSLVYSEKPAWTVFDYSHFKFDKEEDFGPGHDNFDTIKFLEEYGFEDHYFYLAWVKGYDTPMKIKMHIDPSSSIEIVSIAPYRLDPEHYTHSDTTIYCWDWPDKFLAFMPLPDLPKEDQK